GMRTHLYKAGQVIHGLSGGEALLCLTAEKNSGKNQSDASQYDPFLDDLSPSYRDNGKQGIPLTDPGFNQGHQFQP
ncbi:MAG: hypothetical protein ACMUIM_07465, partial [bacterium]